MEGAWACVGMPFAAAGRLMFYPMPDGLIFGSSGGKLYI